ncbi:MAG: chemotaxis protein CheX [Micrococcales bacterium]|nr:chemotaxis protein CheX [Micrococcales bacterium]MCL2668436.1 chemotaxis protein CheX [Micrococcales bacterium]
MTTTTVDFASVFEIAQAVFAAMVDGDEGLLVPRDDVGAAIADPMVAWVNVHGPYPGRTALTTSSATAYTLVRALLDVPADTPMAQADIVDAFGEIANVVGGNVKSLLPGKGTLGLPHVGSSLPPTLDALVVVAPLAWRGEPLDIAVWFTQERGEEE